MTRDGQHNGPAISGTETILYTRNKTLFVTLRLESQALSQAERSHRCERFVRLFLN